MYAMKKKLPREVCMRLMEFGEECNPSFVDRYGNTALIWAMINKMSSEVCVKLMEFGEMCKPSQFNYYDGYTALIWAMQNNMPIEVCMKLLSLSSNIKHIDKCGKTALSYAIEYGRHKVICMKLLELNDIQEDIYEEYKKCEEYYQEKKRQRIDHPIDPPTIKYDEKQSYVLYCMICTTNIKNVVYAKCHHNDICGDCYELLPNKLKCLKCNQISNDVIKIYV